MLQVIIEQATDDASCHECEHQRQHKLLIPCALKQDNSQAVVMRAIPPNTAALAPIKA